MRIFAPVLMLLLLFGCGDDDPTSPNSSGANIKFLPNPILTESYSGYARVLGDVINAGNRRAIFVKVYVTYRNENGQNIGTDFTYINGQRCTLDSGISTDTCLDPNATGSFEIRTLEVMYSDVAKFDLRTDWEEH